MTTLVCRLSALLVLFAGVGAIAFAARFGTGGGLVAIGIFVVTFGIVTALWALGRIARDVARIERRLNPPAAKTPTPKRMSRKARAAEKRETDEAVAYVTGRRSAA